MNDKSNEKSRLINELTALRQQISRLQASEAERKQTEAALRKSERQYKRIFDSSPEVIGIVDTKGDVSDVNKKLYEWVGYRPEEVIGKNCLELPFLSYESKAIAMEKLSKIILGEDVSPYELEFITKRGKKRVGRILSNPIRDENDKLIGVLVMASDITEQKQAEEALTESEKQYKTLTENINVGIYRNTPGPKGKFIEANPAIIKMFGYKNKEEFFAKNVADLYQNPKDRIRFNEKMLRDGFVKNEELQLKRKDGTPFIGSVSAVAVKDENVKVKYYDGMVEDITERKKWEQQLEHMATHDTLTGLPNRTLFKDRLKMAIEHARRKGQKLAVMLLDLDRFKDINDTLGHTVGDKLLQCVGDRLSSNLRRGDTVSRMGGDEFMLILPDIVRIEDAGKIAKKILIITREPFTFDNHELHITTSIGIAIYPNNGENTDILMRNADIAMYCAKEKGRDNCQRYTEDMNIPKN